MKLKEFDKETRRLLRLYAIRFDHHNNIDQVDPLLKNIIDDSYTD
jgi:hypothetical protein